MNLEIRSPFPFQALPRVWGWTEGFRDRISDDFGPKDLAAFIDAMGEKWEQQKTWAVWMDGELGGLIALERPTPYLGVAHWIFKPDFQGKGIAFQASKIAVREMFAEGVGKIAAFPLKGNTGMASLLKRLGARREGVMRGHTLSHGVPADMWLFGLLKGDFENALGNSNSDDRIGHRERGERGAGEQEKAGNELVHADVGTGISGDPRSVDELLPKPDERPIGGARPD